MTHKTLILTGSDIAGVVDWPTILRVVREAFIEGARGRVVMPPKVYLQLPFSSDFRAMPAYLQRLHACGVKWVNVHPRNHGRGLPTVMAIIVINDPATGFPMAVMDGLLVTKLRTAAAAAIAAQTLARSSSHVLGLIGCGAQADAQVEALAHVLPLQRVKVWGYARGEARRFCLKISRRLSRIAFEPVSSLARCVGEADIVVTLTPSRHWLVKRTWLKPGVHINAVGADAPGKQELDPKILQEAHIVVDDRTQAMHGGELNTAIRRRQIRPKDIHATLGEVLIHRRRGRRSIDELTVFDSTGLASHDVAVGAKIVQRAKRCGVGHHVRFFTQ